MLYVHLVHNNHTRHYEAGPAVEAYAPNPSQNRYLLEALVKDNYHTTDLDMADCEMDKALVAAGNHMALAEVGHGRPIEVGHWVHEDGRPAAGCSCCWGIETISQAADS